MLWDREMRKKDDLRVVFFDERTWCAEICASADALKVKFY